MKKTTISLLVFCLYYAGNVKTHAGETFYKDTTELERRTSIDLLPKDKESRDHLHNALFGEFNPEERDDPKDEAEERQLALFRSKVEFLVSGAISRLKAKNQAPVNTPIPDKAVPGEKKITETQAPDAPEKRPEAPAQNQALENASIPEKVVPGKKKITEGMIAEAGDLCMTSKKPLLIVEEMTAFLLLKNTKGWPEDTCRRIADQILNLEDIDDD